jgi:transcriptional regulator with XRE-family HTH domain
MNNRIRATEHPAPAFVVRLRAARLEAGLSQQALGDSLGWGKQRIRDYEEGARAIHPRLLEQWAQAVGRTITTLPAERHCSVCRCTEDNPCDGGCAWVTGEDNTLEVDLCTTCAWVIARDAIASGLYQLAATNGDSVFEARGGLIPQPVLTDAEIDQLQPILDDIEAAGANVKQIEAIAAKHGIEIPRRSS